MKTVLNLFALFLSISAIGFSQTNENNLVLSKSKIQIEQSDKSGSKKVCECSQIQDVPSCFDLIQGDECNSVLFDVNGICLPDEECIGPINYTITLDGVVYLESNSLFDLDWTLPPGDWHGKTMSVSLNISLKNDIICTFGDMIVLNCPDCDCPLTHGGTQCLSITQDEECTTLNFDIGGVCLPDDACISSFRYLFYFNGNPFTINSSTSNATFNIPNGEWDGEVVEVAALIFLSNGDFCVVSNKIVLDCPTCDCPYSIPSSCVQFTLWDEGFCTGATVGIGPSCHPEPDCVESITWNMTIGNYESGHISNNQFTLNWTFPQPNGSWDGDVLKAVAKVTLENGEICTYTNSIILTCDGPPGELDGSEKIETRKQRNIDNLLYPNPVRKGNLVILNSSQISGSEDAYVLNRQGVIMLKIPNGESEFIIPNTFASGIYILRVDGLDNSQTFPFVVY